MNGTRSVDDASFAEIVEQVEGLVLVDCPPSVGRVQGGSSGFRARRSRLGVTPP